MQISSSNIQASTQEQQQIQPRYRFPIATLILCITIFVVFWLESKFEISPPQDDAIAFEDLVAFGAAARDLVISGEFFRLISTNFLSDSFVPLVLNIPFLLFAGIVLERRVGPIHMLAVFFIGGLSGAIFSVIFGGLKVIHFGYMNAVTAMLIAQAIVVKPKTSVGSTNKFKKKFISRLGSFLILLLPIVYLKADPSLYAAGIIGGALAGVVYGILLLRSQKRGKEGSSVLRKIALAVVLANVFACIYAVYSIYTSFKDYEYVSYSAPGEKFDELVTDIGNGGTKFITLYPRDPFGYLLTANHAFAEKDYSRAEGLVRTALSLKGALDSPRLSSLKVSLDGLFALSLKGQGKLDEAKEQAKMPCSTEDTIVKYLRQEGLCG